MKERAPIVGKDGDAQCGERIQIRVRIHYPPNRLRVPALFHKEAVHHRDNKGSRNDNGKIARPPRGGEGSLKEMKVNEIERSKR